MLITLRAQLPMTSYQPVGPLHGLSTDPRYIKVSRNERDVVVNF